MEVSEPWSQQAAWQALLALRPRLRRFAGREVPMDLTAVRTVLGFQAQYELDLPTHELEI